MRLSDFYRRLAAIHKADAAGKDDLAQELDDKLYLAVLMAIAKGKPDADVLWRMMCVSA